MGRLVYTLLCYTVLEMLGLITPVNIIIIMKQHLQKSISLVAINSKTLQQKTLKSVKCLLSPEKYSNAKQKNERQDVIYDEPNINLSTHQAVELEACPAYEVTKTGGSTMEQ